VGGGEEVVEAGLGERELDLVQVLKRIAEVNEDEVTLVAELGVEGGVGGGIGGGGFKLPEESGGFGNNLVLLAGGAGAPGLPVEAEELMEEAGAFKSKGDRGEIGHGEHLGLPNHRNKMDGEKPGERCGGLGWDRGRAGPIYWIGP